MGRGDHATVEEDRLGLMCTSSIVLSMCSDHCKCTIIRDQSQADMLEAYCNSCAMEELCGMAVLFHCLVSLSILVTGFDDKRIWISHA